MRVTRRLHYKGMSEVMIVRSNQLDKLSKLGEATLFEEFRIIKCIKTV